VRRVVAMLGLLVVTTACGVGASPPKAALVEGHAPVAITVARTTVSKAKTVAPPHIFVIVLENEQYSLSYQHNPNPWLGKKLQKEGTLLTQYYGTGHFSNDNYISMISGQAPNSDTSADCQTYPNFNNSTKPATLNKSGQAVGTGCVFPTNVKTLANQLTTHHVTWHGYMEDMGNTPSREQKTCGVPTLTNEGFDDTQAATPADQYAARHNPFVYFRSLVKTGLCAKNVVPLTALTKALKKTSTTPDFSFITPNLCDDGHDTNCQGPDATGSHAGSLVSIDHFLSVWVPRIQKSPAYKQNGEIIITTDEANLNDDTSCCGEKPGPEGNKPGINGPGGGRIGTLVIGKCVKADVKDAKPYNHYSLLRSLENIYGIKTGGADGKGHLGYAGMKGLHPFGKDLFSRCTP
jgi:hypothetical protein